MRAEKADSSVDSVSLDSSADVKEPAHPDVQKVKSLRDLVKVSSKVNANLSKVKMNQNAIKFKENILETLKD